MEIGNFLVEVGGYEQTNVDFYKIINIKGKTATLQKVGNDLVENCSGMSGKVIPNENRKIGEEFKKRIMICKYNNKEYCKMDYHCAYIWDGNPMFCSWWY